MKGGKAGRKRRQAGDAATRRSGGKPNQAKGSAKRPGGGAPKKGARKKTFGARSTSDDE
jgi:hypothetical protein